MWLKLSFFDDRPSLLAAVMSDGKVYFKTSDLGRFLGYSNSYSFAKRYGTGDFRKMVPWKSLQPHGKISGENIAFPVNTTMVFDFEEMISTIRKTLPNHALPFDEKRIEELKTLWYLGVVSIKKNNDGEYNFRQQMPDPKSHLSYKKPFPLKVRMGRQSLDDDVVNLQEWIVEFSDRVAKVFEELDNLFRRQEENVGEEERQNDCCESKSNKLINDFYDTPPPSVNTDFYYSSPPPSCSSTYQQPSVEQPPQHFKSSFYPVFGLEYDGFENNLPEEIHLYSRGIRHVFVEKK